MRTPLTRVRASLDQQRQARAEAREALHLLADKLEAAAEDGRPAERRRR